MKARENSVFLLSQVGKRYRKKALKTPFILNRLGLNLLGEFSVVILKISVQKHYILCYMLLNLEAGKKGINFTCLQVKWMMTKNLLPLVHVHS